MNSHSHTQSEVVIYGTSWCPYCRRAKNLLDHLGVRYREIDVDADPSKRREMAARAQGRRTVPQIFIGEHGIGGCDDLYALESIGGLAGLLGPNGQGQTPEGPPHRDREPSGALPRPFVERGQAGGTAIGKRLKNGFRAWIKLLS